MAKREPIRVLVVDDAVLCRAMLADAVRRDARFRLVGEAESVGDGLTVAARERPDVVILDFCLPDRSGFDAIPDFRRASPGVRVVLCSDKVGRMCAASAAQLGADAYVEKAQGPAAILETVVATPRSDALTGGAQTGSLRWIGESEASRRVRAQLALAVARRPRVLLITGERGTGKGHAARVYHAMSACAKGEFIKMNLAGLAEGVIGSEFRGHVAGAYTGAAAPRAGYIESAAGGILLLDEIADMRLDQQGVLLDVLEDGTVTPVGSSTPRRAGAHFVALTNRDLPAAVEAGTFRADLYDRITQFCIELPPLRERREDIPELVAFKLVEIAERTGRSTAQRCTPEALAVLGDAPWPGNVRKLFDAVALASTLAGSDLLIDLDHVRAAIRATGSNARLAPDRAGPVGTGSGERRSAAAPLSRLWRAAAMDRFYRWWLLGSLVRTNGGEAAVARLVGVSRQRIHQARKNLESLYGPVDWAAPAARP